METINMTLENKEIAKKLQEEFGVSEFTAEKLTKRCETDSDFDIVCDAIGRIQAIEKTADEQAVSKLRFLLHSKRVQYNFGGIKMLGYEEVPQILMDLSTILSHCFKEEYKPSQQHHNYEKSASAGTFIESPQIVSVVVSEVPNEPQATVDIKEDADLKLLREASEFFDKNPEMLIDFLLEQPKEVKKAILSAVITDLL